MHYTDINLMIEEGLNSGIFVESEGVVIFSEQYQEFKKWKEMQKDFNSFAEKYVKEYEKTEKVFDDWIAEWNSKWPTPSITGSRNLRSGLNGRYGVKRKMKKFMEDNPQYTQDIINRATDSYLEREKQRNFRYTKESAYFISKHGEASKLEAECDLILNNEETISNSEKWNKLG